MQTRFPPRRQVAQALALAGLVSIANHAGAADVYLCAKPVGLIVPGGGTVPMWGFAPDDAVGSCSQAATVPGPVISVPSNDSTLNIYLKNTLTTPVSIVINGQSLPAAVGAVPVWTDDTKGPRVSSSQRVRSLVHETIPGAIGVYSFSGVQPGTYLYQSGTHQQVQVQMGLYGGLKKDFAAGQIYPGVSYGNEVTLLYSEVDPQLHAAVSGGTYGTTVNSTLDYQPKYFLINGKAYPDVSLTPLATLTASQPTLLRFLNAGLQTRVPVINGMTMRLLGEDGKPYPWPANPREQYSVMLPAAKTVDAVVVGQVGPGGSSARYPIYDRRMGLSNAGAPDGGMLAFLDVGGGGTAPVFTSTPVTTATEGVAYSYALTATDADPGTSLTFSLNTKPVGMSVDTTSGLIAWTPSAAQAGIQAVTARVTDPTGLYATQAFTITVANVNDPPVANGNTYTMIQGGTLNVPAPGVLGDDSDPDAGDTLTAVNFTAATPATATVTGNANGSFVYTPPVAYTGPGTFKYRAQDNHGATSTEATVSITVNANTAPIASSDNLNAPMRKNSNSGTFPVVRIVLTNDTDPDTAIDPTNIINPASVTITAGPDKNGTVTVNADGTINYTPRLNFKGTEVFSYRVRDNRNALSNTATVRMNVK